MASQRKIVFFKHSTSSSFSSILTLGKVSHKVVCKKKPAALCFEIIIYVIAFTTTPRNGGRVL